MDHIFANKEIVWVQTVGRQGEAVDRSRLGTLQVARRYPVCRNSNVSSSIFSTSTTTASSKIGRGARTRRWIRRMPTPAQLRTISRAARKFKGESWSYPTNMVRRSKRLESRFTVPLRPLLLSSTWQLPLRSTRMQSTRRGAARRGLPGLSQLATPSRRKAT